MTYAVTGPSEFVVILSSTFFLQPAPEKARVEPKKFVKIGRPGYRVTKQRDPDCGQQSLLFQVDYPGKVFSIGNKYLSFL